MLNAFSLMTRLKPPAEPGAAELCSRCCFYCFWALAMFSASCICYGAPAAKAQKPKQPERPTIAPVMLSKQDEALCRVRVGDRMPELSLPQVGGSGAAK